MTDEDELYTKAVLLQSQIEKGILVHGIVNHPKYGEVYAYEADGMGHHLLMDDANVPSLLSLPYLGICEKDDPMYLRTRAFVLGKENPHFNAGTFASGVGSPHTPEGYVWPIALCIQAMTSVHADEISLLVGTLLKTHAGTGFMHESFDPNDPQKFTRSWFAWANSMFGELLYRLYEQGLLETVMNKIDAGCRLQTGCVVV
jgi:meiotically up-regulated gene 157 (Mug157) protein